MNLKPLAAGLLLIGATRHYAWLFAEPNLRGVASKALGALATLCLLAIISTTRQCWQLGLVLAWYAFEETQVALCSVLYFYNPWPLEVGQPLCSAKIGVDIDTASIFIVGALAYCLQKPSRNG